MDQPLKTSIGFQGRFRSFTSINVGTQKDSELRVWIDHTKSEDICKMANQTIFRMDGGICPGQGCALAEDV